MQITIDDDDVRWFRGTIDETNAMYADESRDDWYDADDNAKMVMDRLDDILTQNGVKGA